MAEPFKRLKSGKFVKPFPSGGVPDPAASLGPAYAGVSALVDATLAKAEAVRADPRLSPVGRKAALRDWFDQEAAPVMKRCREAMARADSDLAARKVSIATTAVDKTDLAGALLRQEARTWLRSLEPAKRAALLAVGPVDSLISTAIAEAPIELSGVTVSQKASVMAAAAALAHPDEVQVVRVTEQAMEAVDSVEQVAASALRQAFDWSDGELEEALGAPTLRQRLAAELGEEPAGCAISK